MFGELKQSKPKLNLALPKKQKMSLNEKLDLAWLSLVHTRTLRTCLVFKQLYTCRQELPCRTERKKKVFPEKYKSISNGLLKRMISSKCSMCI